MSIYASTLSFDGEDHVLPGCAAYFEESPGCWEFTGKLCDCPARYNGAIAYRGSHVYPDPEDRRAEMGLAVIPGHVADGGGYDEKHEHWSVACHRPLLRVSFLDPFGGDYPDAKKEPSYGTVLLDAGQVGRLRDELNTFLEHVTGENCPEGAARVGDDRKREEFFASLRTRTEDPLAHHFAYRMTAGVLCGDPEHRHSGPCFMYTPVCSYPGCGKPWNDEQHTHFVFDADDPLDDAKCTVGPIEKLSEWQVS